MVILKKKQEQISKEDDEEFEREFSRMMNESMESRKFEKKSAVLDVPIPMNLRGAQGKMHPFLYVRKLTKNIT